MIKRLMIMLAALMAVCMICCPFAAQAAARHPALATPAQMQSAFASAIATDVNSTVQLPDGTITWLSGDVTAVGGVDVVGSGGYPHSAFVNQPPGDATFTVLTGPYGTSYGTGKKYQQVPNWSDGTFFWAAAGVVDNGTLYVFGTRVQAPGTVIGDYMASFDINSGDTFSYDTIATIPAPVSSVAKGTDGWWLYYTTTHGWTGSPPRCTALTDCWTGNAYWIAFNSVSNVSAWSNNANIIPATVDDGCASGACGLGNVVSVNRLGTGSWMAVTKEDDILGSDVIRLNSSGAKGPWTVTDTIAAPPHTSGDCTYSAQAHPYENEPSGTWLITHAENSGCGNGGSPYYDPTFFTIPAS